MRKNRNLLILAMAIIVIQSSGLVYAQSFPLVEKSCNPQDIKDSSGNIIVPAEPCEWNDLTGTVRKAIVLTVTELAPALAFIFILWGGFLMMLGGPNPGSIKKGQDIIKTALIGYILVLLSGFIIDLVLGFLGGEGGIKGLKFGK